MTTIRVIDFETSGMEPPEAQVVEVGFCDLTRGEDGRWTVAAPGSWLCFVPAIPPEVRAVHHISTSMLIGRPVFDPEQLFLGSHLAAVAAHNMEFEAKFIGKHGLPAICTLKAAYRVWPQAPGHSNSVLRYWLEDEGQLSLDDDLAMPPHRAGPDAYVTAHILKALLEAGTTGAQLAAWTREPRLPPTCPIGKFRGKPWADVETGFLNWMVAQPTMEGDLKWNAQRELDRRAGRGPQ
jgi:exodeoxyribonuclease X